MDDDKALRVKAGQEFNIPIDFKKPWPAKVGLRISLSKGMPVIPPGAVAPPPPPDFAFFNGTAEGWAPRGDRNDPNVLVVRGFAHAPAGLYKASPNASLVYEPGSPSSWPQGTSYDISSIVDDLKIIVEEADPDPQPPEVPQLAPQ